MTPIDEALRARIERHGPVGYDVVVHAALYDPAAGFYATGGQAGRRGDFITSPEVGPLFGALVGRAIDAWWHRAGQPSVFVVVEVGAGPGSLARSVLQGELACRSALRYMLVESSAAQRAQHGRGLLLEDPASASASLTQPAGDEPRLDPPKGPIVLSLPHLPLVPAPCIVIANELLDNLPFRLAERVVAGWREIRVGVDGASLVEAQTPLDSDESAWLDSLAPQARPGDRVPIQRAAAAWVEETRARAGPTGRVVAFDYATSTADLASRPSQEWLRTFRSHARGGPPLERLGTQDITCEVAIDQLGVEPVSDMAQADWLRAHGIEDLVAEGRTIWEERAAIGDLAAVRARSRMGEAEALTDPSGLGAFRVLEWPGR